MTKAHVTGFVAALVIGLVIFIEPQVKKIYRAIQIEQQLSQVIATDQKTGQQYTVGDVLTAMAAERVQSIIQSQQQGAKAPASK